MHTHPPNLLPALVRIEHAREPVTDRTTLPIVLEQVATELRSLLGVAQVTITLRADLFVPPFALEVRSGTAGRGATAAPPPTPPVHGGEPDSTTSVTGMARNIPTPASTGENWTAHLHWAGVELGTVTLRPPPNPPVHGGEPDASALETILPLLLRVASESIAEVRAVELLVQQTQEQVRRQLALDLHDNVKQALPAILLLARNAAADVDTHPQRAVERLQAIQEAARQGLEQVEFLIGILRGQSTLEDLHTTLIDLREQFRSIAPDLQIDVALDMPDVPAPIAACIVSLVRNALSNTVQHAQAQTAQIVIRHDQTHVLVQVYDDGRGCHPDTALAAPGIGMESMFERVKHLKGQTILRTTDRGGLCVEARLPLPH